MSVKRLESWNFPQYVSDFFGKPLTFMRVMPGYYRIVGQKASYGFRAKDAKKARRTICRYTDKKLNSMGIKDKRRRDKCEPVIN